MSSIASVRVCARFRPVNAVEKSENAKVCISIPQSSQVDVKIRGKETKKFFLDHIFPPNSEQEKVYDYTGRPLMTEILKGYNGTMFAYGQTGSGKTFTMEGDMESERFMGLIPRMVDAIFQGIMDADEMEFVVKVSYVEIYCEKIQDLLEVGNSNLRIRESKAQGIYIEGVSSPFVGSSDEIMGLMEDGADNRACASTRMNETSSRSHAVFIFRLIATNKATQTKKMSKLMMVDLAGSEKTRKTQARGQRLDEAKQINKSLSALGQVISALTTGKGHVPYRNSKLTRLLSDSLGGNSKTCIIVTCSPCDYNCEETISTLRFGVNCKRVKNKPKVNEELSIAEYKALIEKKNTLEQRLLRKIAALESQVAALKEALLAAGGNVEEALRNAEVTLEEEKVERTSNQPDNQLSLYPHEPSTVRALTGIRSNAAFEMLKERVDELEELYNQECEDKERYMDDAADLRLELEEAENRIRDVEEEKMEVERKKNFVEEDVEKLSRALGDFRLKQSKLELMRNESNLQIERLRQENNQLSYQLKQAKAKLQEAKMVEKPPNNSVYLNPLTEKEQDTLDLYDPAKFDFENEGDQDKIEKNYQELYKKLLMMMQTVDMGEKPSNKSVYLNPLTEKEKDTLELYNPAKLDFGNEDDQAKIKKSYGELHKRLLTVMQTTRQIKAEPESGLSKPNSGMDDEKLRAEVDRLKRKIRELEEEDERKAKELENMQENDKKNDSLRRNWRNQLLQMEQAVYIANKIHGRDRMRFTSEIAERESELDRLKMFIAKLHGRKRKRSRKTGRANNVMVPVDHKISTKERAKKRRATKTKQL